MTREQPNDEDDSDEAVVEDNDEEILEFYYLTSLDALIVKQYKGSKNSRNYQERFRHAVVGFAEASTRSEEPKAQDGLSANMHIVELAVGALLVILMAVVALVVPSVTIVVVVPLCECCSGCADFGCHC
ncbi:hypothetical protein L2E82_39611 [Cichorium intybus]|uniref:Uncharacterized protein n=1 Tax=Cichorium intybus TaxID=13427 RepID=A0ACB9AJ13_CICIN|nr:hypothetical protein L2E82_39611 [Cichorium intybus]